MVVNVDDVCPDNGGDKPRRGCGDFWGVDHPWNQSARLPSSDLVNTNQRAEISAAILALQRVKEEEGIKQMTICRDSK